MKRILDFVGALFFIVLGLPVFIVIWLWTKLDSNGPTIFRQPRAGLHGKPFTLLKFRSMVVDSPDVRNADGSTFNSDDDPRVTRVGRFLRKSSLDELPQLFNVLNGDMSLVGPRPDLVSQLELYDEEGKKRLNVKPGITGLAQISGRNTISWERRNELDLAYAETHSVIGDFAILFRTIGYVLSSKGVYRKGVQGAEGK